jgi:hypothetical protein
MTEDALKKLILQVPEEELPMGHVHRFRRLLTTAIPIEQKRWTLQHTLIAASIAALIAGTLMALALHNRFPTTGPLLAESSVEFCETELYMKNQIALKLEKLAKSKKINREVLTDITKVDESFRLMRNDLKKNPGDMRLISAVLETYQTKIDFLDEVLEKTR